MTIRAAIVAFVAVAACVAVSSILGAAAPAPGWTTTCRIIDVYDGDTVTVEIRKTMRVRMLDCWAPEIRGGTAESKAAGIASRDHLKGLAEGKDAVLHVPQTDRIGEETSLSRILGHVWIDGDKQSLSERQVAAGHATKDRPK
jgi:endonuclease YncB( thermonuclease family)